MPDLKHDGEVQSRFPIQPEIKGSLLQALKWCALIVRGDIIATTAQKKQVIKRYHQELAAWTRAHIRRLWNGVKYRKAVKECTMYPYNHFRNKKTRYAARERADAVIRSIIRGSCCQIFWQLVIGRPFSRFGRDVKQEPEEKKE